MTHDEFFAKVREDGQYTDRAEAERVTGVVLGLLGSRLTSGEAKDLASQLPAEMKDLVLDGPEVPGSVGVEDFVALVAEKLDTSKETARSDASAVLTTLAESISGGQLNQVLSQLQSGYAELFGKPELT